VKGFKKCCVSSAVDDGMLLNDNGKDGHVRRQCEEDEGTDCEDEHSDTDW
jgi:hypothetical protein